MSLNNLFSAVKLFRIDFFHIVIIPFILFVYLGCGYKAPPTYKNQKFKDVKRVNI